MKKLIIAVCISLLSITTVFAQGVDDKGNPNDPATNERANSCYEGGNMAGKCDSDWAWTCGWYVMRWEADNTYIVPDECSSLVFYAPPPEPTLVVPTCYSTNIAYLKFTGGVNVSPSADEFSDADCTDYLNEVTLVEAEDKTSADAACIAIITPRGFPVFGSGKLTSAELPDNLWYCSYAVGV